MRPTNANASEGKAGGQGDPGPLAANPILLRLADVLRCRALRPDVPCRTHTARPSLLRLPCPLPVQVHLCSPAPVFSSLFLLSSTSIHCCIVNLARCVSSLRPGSVRTFNHIHLKKLHRSHSLRRGQHVFTSLPSPTRPKPTHPDQRTFHSSTTHLSTALFCRSSCLYASQVASRRDFRTFTLTFGYIRCLFTQQLD